MLKRPSSITIRKNNYESSQLKEGQRVTIPSLENATGILRYVGQVDKKTGIWAGIELDIQGQGKNDGSVQGKKYFICPPNTGLFIAVNKIITHPPSSPTPVTLSRLSTSSPKACKSSNTTPKTSSTPKPSSIIKPKSSRTFTTPKNSFTPKKPSTSPKKKATPRNSFTPTTASKLSSTPNNKKSKRHSLNSFSQLRRSHYALTMDAVPPLQLDSSSDTTTASESSHNNNNNNNNEILYHEATHQLYDMLEKTQRERDLLQHQIKTKEAAWERLVSSKESLSLQVQENQSQQQRLSRDLEHAQSHVEELQRALAEREAHQQRSQEQQTQGQKRLDRLENLVRDLQAQLTAAKDEQWQERRTHAGELEQIRRQLAMSDETNAVLEKECEELRRAGLEAIHAYETSVVHMKQQHEMMSQQKTYQIQQLEMTIRDLRQKQSSLFDDDDHEVDDYQRHRLEEQLDLAMTELDHERNTIHTLTLEVEQLRLELTQQRHQCIQLEKKLEGVQIEFEKEVQDKKRLIEEADAAFELQAKAEDELYQWKLSKKSEDQAYHQLVAAHQKLEREFEMMTMDADVALQEKIKELEKENERERHNLMLEKKKVQGLSQDLAMLESLVDNRVLAEETTTTDLEVQLEEERSKVEYLQNELKAAGKYDANEMTIVYCEYCDKYKDHITEDCPHQNETF